MPRRALIIGCGYIGLPLARELKARGDSVTGWVRSQESADQLQAEKLGGIIVGSVAEEACWNGAGKFDAVIHCASSGGGGADVYREVYLEGARQMNRQQPQARRVFVSSTSVYGQTDGAWVSEDSLATPASETSRILREAEEEALGADAVVVRAAGIYGPSRAVLFEKFRRGHAVIEGDGTRWINQVHQSDLVGAILHLLEFGATGQIYNAADDEPVMLREYYGWCSETLQLPFPPPGTADPKRKRGLTNKRIANRKLRATGWAPRYPTFRQGLAARLGND